MILEKFPFLKELFIKSSYKNDTFFVVAGPCVIENEDITLETAATIKKICEKLELPLIFKSSYKKANRTKGNSYSGMNDIATALKILQKVKVDYFLPTITDIHTPQEVKQVAEFVDVLQIPAFLCRQTDLLIAAGNTNKIVNIKKGQFMSALGMKFALEKVYSTQNNKLMLTERGNSFGYNELIVDFRNLKIMQEFSVPVIMDCTHSIQQPNTEIGITMGTPKYIETIARAAIANEVDGIFIETHPDPKSALSDGANMLPLSSLENLLTTLVNIRQSI